MVLRIIKEIQGCLENDFHFAALALALTLPDICGKAAFPQEKSSETRYKKWFDDNIGKVERDRRQEDEDFADLPFLSGELMYQLRCSFLHSGDTDVSISKLTKPWKIKDEQNKLTSSNLILRKREKGTDIRERICARSFFALYYFGRKTSTGGTKQ